MWFYFLLFFVILLFCFEKKADNRIIFYYFIGVVLILVAGLRSEDICRDYNTYRTYYEDIKNGGNHFFAEPTFVLITLITPRIEWLMLIYATLSITIIFVGIKRLTEFYFFSILIYFSTGFIMHEMTQIRVGVAAALLLLCIEPIFSRNFIKFLIISLIAASFHFSALIILPFYFFRPNKFNILIFSLIIPASYLLHILGIHLTSLLYLFPIGGDVHQKLMMQIQSMTATGKIAPINVFNIIQLLRIVLIAVLIWKSSLLQNSNKYFNILVKIYIFSVASFVLFADIPVFSFRISELLGVVEIILLPMIIYLIRQKILAYFLCFLFAFGALYMAIIYGGLLKPYFM
jgi:hypothetical protein